VPVDGTNRTVPSPELQGDLAVHGFWTKGQTAIFDVRVTDTDQPTNRNIDPAKALLRHEKEKKSMMTFALPVDAPSPHLSSRLMVFLVKKQLWLQNVLPPVLLPNGNVHTPRYAAMFDPDFR
jgi:hypothetical protein